MNTGFVEEIKAALAKGPESDACRERLVEIGKQALQANKLLELTLAFSQLTDVDWDGYLKLYPDVAQLEMQPLLHYIKFGLWEKRILPYKIAVTHTPVQPVHAENVEPPIVSVIMPNYNNGDFLEKSIGSLRKQTLANIEIVVVDDASTDNSMQVLTRLAQEDNRIRIIQHETNKGTHVARATGVEAAAGQYIMFLDPDDYYIRYACETACEAMSEGADIVHFNIRINNHGASGAAVARISEVFNGLPQGQYTITDILDRQLKEKKMLHNVCNKIFRAPLIKSSFKLMEEGYFTAGEDMYEFLFILPGATSYRKIDSVLYVYNYGLGIATRQITDNNKIPLHSALYSSLDDYYQKNNLAPYVVGIKAILFNWSLSVWNNLDGSQYSYFINDMCTKYGKDYVLAGMIGAYWGKPEQIRHRLKKFLPSFTERQPLVIAIVLPANVSAPGMAYLDGFVEQLKKKGILIYGFMDRNLKLYPGDRRKPWILPLKPSAANAAVISSRITEMLADFAKYNVDLMVEVNSVDKMDSWNILMTKLFSIPRCLMVPELFSSDKNGNDWRALADKLSENEKVICASPEDEIVLRIMGVDAEYGFNLYSRLTRNVILEKNLHRQLDEDVEQFFRVVCKPGCYSQWQLPGEDVYKKTIHTLVPVT